MSSIDQNGRRTQAGEHTDGGEPRRRDEAAGSGGLPTYGETYGTWSDAMQEWGRCAMRATQARRRAAACEDAVRARESRILLGQVPGIAIEGRNAQERDASLRLALLGDTTWVSYRSQAEQHSEDAKLAELEADQARARVRWCEATLPLLAAKSAAQEATRQMFAQYVTAEVARQMAEPAPPIAHIPHDVPTENCPTCDGAGWLRFTTAEHRPLGRMRCQDGCDDGRVVAKAPVPTPIDGGAAGGPEGAR